MKILKKKLLKKFQSLKIEKFDLFVDYDVKSGSGHFHRSKSFIQSIGFELGDVFKIKKGQLHNFSTLNKHKKGLLVDSFYLCDRRILKHAHNYKVILLIDDGPVRSRWKHINYVNWELDRHLTKRFSKTKNMFCGINLFPLNPTSYKVKALNHDIFVYSSTDNKMLVRDLLLFLQKKYTKNILVVGEYVNGLQMENVTFHERVSEDFFNSAIASSSVVVSPGGFTFYKAFLCGKKTIIYENKNETVRWERSKIRQHGGCFISAKDLQT